MTIIYVFVFIVIDQWETTNFFCSFFMGFLLASLMGLTGKIHFYTWSTWAELFFSLWRLFYFRQKLLVRNCLILFFCFFTFCLCCCDSILPHWIWTEVKSWVFFKFVGLVVEVEAWVREFHFDDLIFSFEVLDFLDKFIELFFIVVNFDFKIFLLSVQII